MTFLVKISLALKPFHKLTYVLATVLVASIVYQLIFLDGPQAEESNKVMLSLLALAWVALVNLMIQIYSREPVISPSKSSLLERIKNKLHRGLYSALSFIFIGMSIAVIVLSYKMLTV
jgi:hypothetical protein